MPPDDDSPFSEDAEESDLPPQMASAVDRRRQRRARQLAKRQKTEQLGLWRTLLSTKTGRRDVYALMGGDKLFAVNFVAGPNGFPQPEATWFELGKRAYGLELYHQLLVIDSSGIAKMHRENDPAFAEPPKRQYQREDDYREPWPVEDE